MNSLLFKNIGVLLLYVLAQALVLNGICYFNLFTPFLFILFIINQPVNTGRINLMFYAFAIGLLVDIFSNTTGIHAFACVFVAYFRPAILKSFTGSDAEEMKPSFLEMGQLRYMMYAMVVVLIHHFLFYLVENSSFTNLGAVILKTIGSAVLTLILIFMIEYLRYRWEKR